MGKSKSKKITIAIFLAHLNPLTLSHEKIIQNLLNDYKVYIFPVRFLKNKEEVTTRSFPFSFETRKQMILESFDYNENIGVLDNYAFFLLILNIFLLFSFPAISKTKKKYYFELAGI